MSRAGRRLRIPCVKERQVDADHGHRQRHFALSSLRAGGSRCALVGQSPGEEVVAAVLAEHVSGRMGHVTVGTGGLGLASDFVGALSPGQETAGIEGSTKKQR